MKIRDLKKLAQRKLGHRADVCYDSYGYLQCFSDSERADRSKDVFIEIGGYRKKDILLGALSVLPDLKVIK